MFYSLNTYPVILFCKIQISTYNEKIILKFIVLSIALAGSCAILHIVIDLTHIKKSH